MKFVFVFFFKSTLTSTLFSRKQSSCQCRGHRFDSWSGKIPHGMEQLSRCTRAVSLYLGVLEPQLPSLCAAASEAHLPGARALHRRSRGSERPERCGWRAGLLAATREAPTRQPRPSTDKNKQTDKYYIL